jgi:hypothetical protein
MSDFILARESCEIIPDYNVDIAQFENLKSTSRLITPDMIAGWKIESPALTDTDKDAYFAFFNSKYGSLTSFTFTCPHTKTEYNVRFKQGSFRSIYKDAFFKISFEFERVF